VELTAGKELLLSCGESSLQMQSGSGDIQMYANEVKLESPRNATPLDLLSQDEVALLLSEYEKQKTDYLTNNILYYMDASGYTGVDIDQARQTTAYKIIDGLVNCGKELERLGINLKGGGAAVASNGMVLEVGGSVAIAEACEAEIAIAIAGILAAAGFGGGQGGSDSGWQRMTSKESAEAAKNLGFEKTNYRTKDGEPVYYNKKTKTYISQDIGSGDGSGSRNGGIWKQAKSPEALNSKSTRMGTYDANLIRAGD